MWGQGQYLSDPPSHYSLLCTIIAALSGASLYMLALIAMLNTFPTGMRSEEYLFFL